MTDTLTPQYDCCGECDTTTGCGCPDMCGMPCEATGERIDALTPQEALAEALPKSIHPTWLRGKFNATAWENAAEAILAALPEGWRLTNEARASTDAELRALRQALEAVMNAPVFHSGIDHPALERANRLLRGSDR